jgi:hypothetical protein
VIFIDLSGLTSVGNPRTLVRAYGLSGYLIPPERRLAVLKRMREDATPHLVYTGAEGVDLWRGAPAHIQVRVLPGDAEVGRRKVPKDSPDDVSPDDLQGLEQVGEQGTTSASPYQYRIVDNASALAEFSQWLGAASVAGTVVGLDTETTSEDDRTADLVGVGVSFDKNHNYYLPLNGPVDKDLIMGLLWKYFVEQTTRFVAHNAKYDIKVLARALDSWYNQRKEAVQ